MRKGVEAEKELGAVGAGSCISHAQDSELIVFVNKVLIRKLFTVNTFPSCSIELSDIAALSHETGNNSMKYAPLEAERLTRLAYSLLAGAEASKVLRGLRSIAK